MFESVTLGEAIGAGAFVVGVIAWGVRLECSVKALEKEKEAMRSEFASKASLDGAQRDLDGKITSAKRELEGQVNVERVRNEERFDAIRETIETQCGFLRAGIAEVKTMFDRIESSLMRRRAGDFGQGD